MSRKMVEQRLVDGAARLKRLHEDLRIAEEQLEHFSTEAEDARIRALVSETPVAEREHRDAAKHADAMRRHRAELLADIERLETQQNELLDRMLSES